MATVGAVETITEPDLESSIDVAAPPEAVWALVSDVTRTPEWSPVVRSSEWLDGFTEAVVGARFVGHNRFNGFRWTRRCQVSEAEPGSVFSFSTFGRDGTEQTRWRYRLEPTEAGTRITLGYEIVSTPRWVSFLRRLPGGAKVNERQAQQNVDESLERLRTLLR